MIFVADEASYEDDQPASKLIKSQANCMGALRAAELHTFGMVGMGQVFENFAHGDWQDDDEVALIHGPAELNYLLVSRSMVDLRHDLNAACVKKILTRHQADKP